MNLSNIHDREQRVQKEILKPDEMYLQFLVLKLLALLLSETLDDSFILQDWKLHTFFQHLRMEVGRKKITTDS